MRGEEAWKCGDRRGRWPPKWLHGLPKRYSDNKAKCMKEVARLLEEEQVAEVVFTPGEVLAAVIYIWKSMVLAVTSAYSRQIPWTCCVCPCNDAQHRKLSLFRWSSVSSLRATSSIPGSSFPSFSLSSFLRFNQ